MFTETIMEILSVRSSVVSDFLLPSEGVVKYEIPILNADRFISRIYSFILFKIFHVQQSHVNI